MFLSPSSPLSLSLSLSYTHTLTHTYIHTHIYLFIKRGFDFGVLQMKIDWLMLTASQRVWGYFMPRGQGIAFIVRLYLHLCVVFVVSVK